MNYFIIMIVIVMEFVYHDGEKLNKIIINNKCTYIQINNNKYNVTDVGLFTEHQGKFQTDEYIIKYSKGTLYLYDKKFNVLGIYKFSKFLKNKGDQVVTTNVVTSVASVASTTNVVGILVNRFILKEGYYIELYRNNDNFYIKYNNTKIEKVIESYGIGRDFLYITECNNKLHVSTKRNSKWNGIPIGVLL